MTQPVYPQAVIAMAVLRAMEVGTQVEIEDISKLFVELKRKGIPCGQVALRRVPGGVYSEDVEAFVGRQLAAGYARARSPIQFLPDGLRICRAILESEKQRNPESLAAAAAALDFNLADFSGSPKS